MGCDLRWSWSISNQSLVIESKKKNKKKNKKDLKKKINIKMNSSVA